MTAAEIFGLIASTILVLVILSMFVGWMKGIGISLTKHGCLATFLMIPISFVMLFGLPLLALFYTLHLVGVIQ